MPEGDTVLTAANNMHEIFAGSTLTRGELNWPSAPVSGVQGKTVSEVTAYAKHMLMRFTDGTTLRTHLRMDGTWRIVKPYSREAKQPSPYTRAIIGTTEWVALGINLGMLDLWRTKNEPQELAHMGPDILSHSFVPTPYLARAQIDPQQFLAPKHSNASDHDDSVMQARNIDLREALAAEQNNGTSSPKFNDTGWRLGIENFNREDQNRPIAESLLDQTLVSGIGTIHMAEALFALQVNPWEPISSANVPKILAFARTHMIRAARHYPQGRKIHVHERNGKPCVRCNNIVLTQKVGPPLKLRPVFYCPKCQPLIGSEPKTSK